MGKKPFAQFQRNVRDIAITLWTNRATATAIAALCLITKNTIIVYKVKLVSFVAHIPEPDSLY